MDDLLSRFIYWLEELPVFWAYLTLLLIAYGENVLPPIPGDMVVVFGGYLAGLGQLSLWLVVLLATIGGALGFMTMYAIGASLGKAVRRPDQFKWLPKRHIDRSEEWLQRWGYGVVAANRFLSGLRSVIALSAGMARMDARKTAAFATLSAALWVLLISWAGYAVGENWEVVSVYLKNYGYLILSLALLAIVVQVARIAWKKRRGK